MKKIVCLTLVFVLCAALLAGCAPKPGPTNPTEAPGPDAPAETSETGELDMEALLKALADQYPDDSAEALAKRLLEDPYFTLYTAEVQNLEDMWTYFPALNETFTGEGLKESACVWDAFGSRAVVYVFTPEEGADAEGILESAKNALDPYWSEEPFDHVQTLVYGGRAFFAVYHDGMEPVTGPIAEKARDFVEMFRTFKQEHPEASVLEIAEHLSSRQKVTSMYVSAVEPGVLTGFGDFEHTVEVTGFADGAGLFPEISPNAFLCYLFRLEDGADKDAFMKDLEEKANPGWNVCIMTNTKIIEAEGSDVLFMMCNE